MNIHRARTICRRPGKLVRGSRLRRVHRSRAAYGLSLGHCCRVDGPNIIPFSNFSGKQPVRVGQYAGLSSSGAYDMAGNVKEWCLNEDNSHLRYILGGAGTIHPTYSMSPIRGHPLNGRPTLDFVLRATKEEYAKAGQPLTPQTRDFSREVPVSDQVFAAYKSLFAYDKTPLHAVIESTEVTEDWTKQRITFDAAYNHERVIAYLFLPKKRRLLSRRWFTSPASMPCLPNPALPNCEPTCMIT